MSWLDRLSLRSRLLGLLSILVLLTLVGGLTAFWYSGQMRDLLTGMIERGMVGLRTAEELEISLVSQKGMLTYYALSGDPDWLTQLEEQRTSFEEWLEKAARQSARESDKALLAEIRSEYAVYAQLRNQVIELYRSGEKEKGAELHWELRERFSAIYDRCERYKAAHEVEIANTREASLARARLYSTVAIVAMLIVLILIGILAGLLINQIIRPIQQLTRAASPPGGRDGAGHEVLALSQSVHGLIEDFDQTHSELERSRERLLRSEKMALIGKLAAEMAHSIRNPMTSIKMRLFSLERDHGLTPAQKEDLDVVSAEMRRLDNIVGNFLEFSRPPRLRMQETDLAAVVKMSLQLLEKRFERHKMEVNFTPPADGLPPIKGDPEMLKEVLINLMVNACEAVGEGGRLTVKVNDGVAEHIGRAVLVSVSDSGPGIPAAIQAKVTEPFFSTKDQGTGLGLSIASRIVDEHGGRLEVRSIEGQGATFIITLPIMEEAT